MNEEHRAPVRYGVEFPEWPCCTRTGRIAPKGRHVTDAFGPTASLDTWRGPLRSCSTEQVKLQPTADRCEQSVASYPRRREYRRAQKSHRFHVEATRQVRTIGVTSNVFVG